MRHRTPRRILLALVLAGVAVDMTGCFWPWRHHERREERHERRENRVERHDDHHEKHEDHQEHKD